MLIFLVDCLNAIKSALSPLDGQTYKLKKTNLRKGKITQENANVAAGGNNVALNESSHVGTL